MPSLDDRFKSVQDAISSGTFDPTGINYTSFSPQDLTPLNPLPALKSTYAPPTATGKMISAQGSSATLSTGDSISTPAPSLGTPANPMDSAVGNFANSVGDYFLRGVIIILGFIFVAVGLKALAPNVLADVRNVGR